MKITYIAKRSREGKFHCYDLAADGIYSNLFGAPKGKIAQEDWLANLFLEHQRDDSISIKEHFGN